MSSSPTLPQKLTAEAIGTAIHHVKTTVPGTAIPEGAHAEA